MINSGEYSTDITLDEQYVLEVDFFYSPSGNGDSDWDCKEHLEVYEYRCYDKDGQVSLDLTDTFVYDKLRKHLREIEIERSVDMNVNF